jgi:hypothetical protein
MTKWLVWKKGSGNWKERIRELTWCISPTIVELAQFLPLVGIVERKGMFGNSVPNEFEEKDPTLEIGQIKPTSPLGFNLC